MKHLFYLFGIAPILWELFAFSYTTTVHSCKKRMEGKKFESYTDVQKTLSILMFLYMIWIFIGLFSSQWIFFIVLLILGFVKKKHRWHIKLDGFISACLLIFIILNAYHLHINFLKLLKNLF